VARFKKVSREAFRPVLDETWCPIELTEDALPSFARAIPEHVRFRVIASGEATSAIPYSADRIANGDW
jgi:hypothetical protein